MDSKNTSSKVKEISEILYNETILPGKEEAKKIIEDAKEMAASIMHDAKEKEQKILNTANEEIKQKNEVFENSVLLAIKQAIENLKSEIMHVFSDSLSSGLKQTLSKEDICIELVQTIIQALKNDGINSDLKLHLSKEVDFNKVADAVIASVQTKLEKGDVEVTSGVSLLLKDKKISLKVTEKTIADLLADSLPEVLRGKVFA